MQPFWHQLLDGLRQTPPLEFIAVVAGIASVYFSRKENILLYPVGLVNTIIYIYLSLQGHLYGEASVNLYYTIMSIYGWLLWSRRNTQHEHTLHISYSTAAQWLHQLAFFAAFYIGLFAALTWLQQAFAPDAIPWADAFASATAYTGMWLMARKKVESWYWWIATNIASMPLYFVKGYAFTSVQYFVFLIMAVLGLLEWRRRVSQQRAGKATL
jgi:nicotinamide mononucleotide transporter